MPVRLPEFVHEATVCAAALLIVPAANPAPDAVHVTFEMGILSLPLRRSSAATSVSEMVAPVLVFPLAVIVTGPSAAAMLGDESGSALGKVTVALLRVSFAMAETVTVADREPVAVAAPSPCVATSANAANPSVSLLMSVIFTAHRRRARGYTVHKAVSGAGAGTVGGLVSRGEAMRAAGGGGQRARPPAGGTGADAGRPPAPGAAAVPWRGYGAVSV